MKNTLFTAVIVGLNVSAHAASISWGGAHFSTNYSADGTALQDGATSESSTGVVLFELGVFVDEDGSDFVPTRQNIGEWQDRFVPFGITGTSAYDDSEFASSGLDSNYFGGWIDLGDGAGEVPTTTTAAAGNLVEGRQVYIWGYDVKDVSSGQAPEWFLATGMSGGSEPTDTNWVVPSDEGGNGDFTHTWDINNATTAVIGRIDDNVGDGESVDPGPLDFSDLQFATVPEPSAMLLALMGSLCLFKRRRF